MKSGNIEKIFFDESYERLWSLCSSYELLRKNSGNLNTINRMFRELHTIKGAASFLELNELEGTIELAENLLTELKNSNKSTRTEVLKKLARVIDRSLFQMQELEGSVEQNRVFRSFENWQRYVDNLGKSIQKDIELEIVGERSLEGQIALDHYRDIIIPIVRNCCDHGIEEPMIRTERGKTIKGKIVFKVNLKKDWLFIEISDDGGGIDTFKIKSHALSAGNLNWEDFYGMTNSQINELIFEPGFSTSSILSKISGRGYGMDIVKALVRDKGGNITVDSTKV